MKEDIAKYEHLKSEEEKRLKEIKEKNEFINNQLAKYEELIKKTVNDINLMQNTSAKETETINKEFSVLYEKIRTLEFTQRDLKSEQDKIKFQFEFEINKLNSELVTSEEKLYFMIFIT